MKMKPFLPTALLALGALTSCIDETPALQILGARPFNPDCSIPDNVDIVRGRLNVATADLTIGYNLAFDVVNNLQPVEVEVSETPVSGDDESSSIYIEAVNLGYVAEGLSLPSPDDPASIPLYASLEFDEEGQLSTPLLTAEAVAALVGVTEPTTLDVHVQYVGRAADGSEVKSNTVVFPILVTNEEPLCPPAQRVPPSGPCAFVGINGVEAACMPATDAGTTGTDAGP